MSDSFLIFFLVFVTIVTIITVITLVVKNKKKSSNNSKNNLKKPLKKGCNKLLHAQCIAGLKNKILDSRFCAPLIEDCDKTPQERCSRLNQGLCMNALKSNVLSKGLICQPWVKDC